MPLPVAANYPLIGRSGSEGSPDAQFGICTPTPFVAQCTKLLHERSTEATKPTLTDAPPCRIFRG